jgi:hypothetical protein
MTLESSGTPIVLDSNGPITVGIMYASPGLFSAEVIGGDGNEGLKNRSVNGSYRLLPSDPACEAKQRQMLGVYYEPTTAARMASHSLFEATPVEEACPAFAKGFRSNLMNVHVVIADRLERGLDGRRLVLRNMNKAEVLQQWEWPLVNPPSDTEEDWLARSIASTMAQIHGATASVTLDRLPAAGLHYRVHGVDGGALELTLTSGMWEPSTFVPLARKLWARVQQAPPAEASILPRLLEPRLAELLKATRDLQASLERQPTSARHHEEAALLAGALAMRAPSAAGLYDIRPLLNIMTARLAIAAVLSPVVSNEGELAHAVLDALVGRDVAAFERIQRLSSRLRSPSEAAWGRAVRMRASSDWRIFKTASKPSLLEQLEYIGALARVWTQERALSAWREFALEDDFALACRVLVFPKNNIELGGELAGPCVAAQAEEARFIARSYGTETLSDWWTKPAPLDSAPIPQSVWRQFAEGSLVDPVWRLDSHLGGLAPNSASRLQFRQDAVGQIGFVPAGKALWADWAGSPLAGKFVAVKGKEPCESLVAALTADRLALGALGWTFVTSCRQLPRRENLFKPVLPTGTMFDHKTRFQWSGMIDELNAKTWVMAWGRHYYSSIPFQISLFQGEGRLPAARDFRVFSGEADYNLGLASDWARIVAEQNRFEDALGPSRAACRMDPTECFQLNQILRALGRTDEAYDVAIRAHSLAGGTVNSSVEAGWLIDEHIRRGRLAKAKELVANIAETGSAAAMLSEARLSEREGAFDKAKELWVAMDQSYGSQEAKVFEMRQSLRSGKATRAEIAASIQSLGPKQKGTMQQQPQRISVQQLYDEGAARQRELMAMGLVDADRITQVNGYPVENKEQFFAALTLDDSLLVTFTTTRYDGSGTRIVKGYFYHLAYGRVRMPT